MSAHLQTLSPVALGLDRFARSLPARAPIAGEDPGSYDAFHAGMVETLVPCTPYEQVIADNLIGIEWELVQHRRMREASLRRIMREAICEAVCRQHRESHEAALEAAWQGHVEAGGTKDDWKKPAFDAEAARQAGAHLAARAVSRNPEKQMDAQAEIAALGMDPVELMGEAYRSHERGVAAHHGAIVELERRRREVRRDFDALQRSRPVDIDDADIDFGAIAQ